MDIDATTSPEHKVVAAVCFSRPFTTLFSFTFDWATNVPLKRIGNDSISVAALPSTFILCARCLNGRWIQFGGLRWIPHMIQHDLIEQKGGQKVRYTFGRYIKWSNDDIKYHSWREWYAYHGTLMTVFAKIQFNGCRCFHTTTTIIATCHNQAHLISFIMFFRSTLFFLDPFALAFTHNVSVCSMRYRDYLVITKEDRIRRHYRTIYFRFFCFLLWARMCVGAASNRTTFKKMKKVFFFLFSNANFVVVPPIGLRFCDPLIFCNDCATKQRCAKCHHHRSV